MGNNGYCLFVDEDFDLGFLGCEVMSNELIVYAFLFVQWSGCCCCLCFWVFDVLGCISLCDYFIVHIVRVVFGLHLVGNIICTSCNHTTVSSFWFVIVDRCDLVISANGKTEKIASGLLNPFLSHLKTAQEQMAKGGYSIILEPEFGSDAAWFTKSTVERCVVESTASVLFRVFATCLICLT